MAIILASLQHDNIGCVTQSISVTNSKKNSYKKLVDFLIRVDCYMHVCLNMRHLCDFLAFSSGGGIMKKLAKFTVVGLLIALSLIVLASCNSEFSITNGDQNGSLAISTSQTRSRTISPDPEAIRIVSYRVEGVHSNGTTAFAAIEFTDSTVMVNDLQAGEWSITVFGLNEDRVVIASQTQTVTIVAKQTATAAFRLQLLEGTGTVLITMQWAESWPEGVQEFATIVGTITPMVEDKEGFGVIKTEGTLGDGLYSVTKTLEEFPTGSYSLKLEFLDAGEKTVGITYVEALNVYKDMVSRKVYTISEETFAIMNPEITMNECNVVSITSNTPGVVFHYTTDGSDPKTSSTAYDTPFAITENTTIKALAVLDGYRFSEIAESSFEVPAIAPTFSLMEGTYGEAQSVALSTATVGATIYYTRDGTTNPTRESTVYSESMAIEENTEIRAIAVHPNNLDSSVASAEYRIKVATPTFSLKEGSYSGAQTLTLTSATAGATIYYTTDGSEPTVESTYTTGELVVSSTATVKAIAVKSGMEPSSVTQASYTIIILDPVETPTFSPDAGEVYEECVEVTLSSSTEGAIIYYTLDGSEPTKASNRYTGSLTITENTTIKAYAVKDGAPDSATATGVFEVTPYLPTFSVEAGTYNKEFTVSLSSSTAGATIYYTTDGNNPTRTSNIYTGEISIAQNTTVKAFAAKTGMTDSAIASVTYKIAEYSGLVVINPPNYTVKIQLPEGWEDGVIVTGARNEAIATLSSAENDESITYRWYMNGEPATNGLGEDISQSDRLLFGSAKNRLTLTPGLHHVLLEITSGELTFSDQKFIRVSDSGVVGDNIFVVGELTDRDTYVFYDKGEYSDGWRYLEAASADWSDAVGDPSYVFGYYRPNGKTNELVGTESAIGVGRENTLALVDAMGDTAYSASSGTSKATYAAKIASEYSATVAGEVYDDWFLPSKDELNEMYENLHKQGLGGFSEDYYWSSTEYHDFGAWNQGFFNGYWYGYYRYGGLRVRPVRAF